MTQKIAVVTGSNKGIGYACVKGLAKEFNGTIYMTARNVELGQKSLETLKSEVGADAAKLKFHQLDITNSDSVNAFRDYLKSQYGGLDVLVNNAAIAFKNDAKESFGEQAEVTCGTNYFGTRRVCDALLPLVREHGRVVNVGSRVGVLTNLPGAELKKQLTDPELTVAHLDSMVNDFVKHAKAGTHLENGYPKWTYAFSKMAQIALSNIQARELGAKNIFVNACCPGYVDTDMTSHKGHKTPEQGADTLIYLATLPTDAEGPKGQFVAERKLQDWVNDPMKFD